MIKRCCVSAFALLLSAPPALADPPPISAYASLPAVTDPRLSPDGSSIAMVAPVKDHLDLVSSKVDGSGMIVLNIGDAADPEWFHWKGNNRLMAGLRFVAYSANNEYAIHTRLAFVDADGKNAAFAKLNKELPQPNTYVFYDSSNRTPQFQDQVISLEPSKPDEILMAVTPQSDWVHPDVMRVNVQTGVAKTVTHESDVVRWLADETGAVRGLVKVKREHWNGYETHRIVQARAHDGDEWQTIDEGDQVQGHRFNLVGFAKDRPNILYVLADSEGGRLEAREYDLTTHTLGTVLASGPVCDAEGFGNAQEIFGFDAPCARDSKHYLDADWQHDYLSIKNALHSDQVWVIDRSDDGKRVLVANRQTVSQPIDYWILDRHGEKANLSRFSESYEGLQASDIQQTTRVNFPSRDGQVLPGFITLPANRSGPIPFVVLVHGGPSARDGVTFNWQVQFLVSRGYGVFQPQFRGSSGFGTAFHDAGLQQWGGRMQDDVTDGTLWLISQKLAEPGRIAIAGAGYGGYSALMGAVKQPTLYAAAAAYDPITDLDKLLHRMRAFAFSDINRPKVKNDQQDADDISPVEHAAEIKVPVLLVHGKKDVNVPYDHSEDMESALKRAGKTVTAFYPELGDAGMNHSAERILWLTELEKLLASTLKTTAAVPGKSPGPAAQ